MWELFGTADFRMLLLSFYSGRTGRISVRMAKIVLVALSTSPLEEKYDCECVLPVASCNMRKHWLLTCWICDSQLIGNICCLIATVAVYLLSIAPSYDTVTY